MMQNRRFKKVIDGQLYMAHVLNNYNLELVPLSYCTVCGKRKQYRKTVESYVCVNMSCERYWRYTTTTD